MDEILDEELKNLFQKHNIPIELVKVLADEAIRITLDDRPGLQKGITFCSNDDGKLFTITRCIEKIRRSNAIYSKPLDAPGCISYAQNTGGIKTAKRKEQIVNLDNLDISAERKKSVCRYVDSFMGNTCSLQDLNAEISEIGKCYNELDYVDEKIRSLERIRDNYKSKVAEIENSLVPNIFRRKKLKLYNQRVLSYIKQIEKTLKRKEAAEEACSEAEVLIQPRRERAQRIVGYNGIISSRVATLIKQYNIPQQEIKRYVAEMFDLPQVPEGLLAMPARTSKIEEKGDR